MRDTTPLLLFFSILIAFILFFGLLFVTTHRSERISFDQESFPCAEDEVLRYWPGVRDHVVCVAIDAQPEVRP